MVLSFSYGPHQLLGPTMPRMSRRSMRALQLKQKKDPDAPPPVEKKEKWPHTYQQISETKEYHALEDYFWFYEEWNLINNRFVKKFGKRLQDMLIELQSMHRVKLENKVVMDNVKRMEDVILPDDWESTLRGSCDTVPKPGPRVEWRDIVEISLDKIIPDRKVVERIGYADKKPRPHTFFEHSDAHLKTRKEDWKRWEKYCASMAERLKNEEPHYPEFPYLKVFGDRVRARNSKDYSFVCKEEQKVYQPSPNVPEEQRPVYHDGPVGYLSPPWLHFACKPGAVTGHTVKLENVGSTALFYRWERRPLESMGVTTPRRTLGVHITNCRNFTVMNGTGSVLPGGAREFVFKFSSDVEGFFMESWVLRVAPRMRRPFKPLYLEGVATLKEIDRHGIMLTFLHALMRSLVVLKFMDIRKLFHKMTQALNHRELMRGIGENLESIQERALKLSTSTEEFRNAEYMFSSEAFNFIKQNLSVEPPIYFIPSVYSAFDVMVRVVREILLQQPPSEEGIGESDQMKTEYGEDIDANSVVSSSSNVASPLPSWAQINASKARQPEHHASDAASTVYDKTLAALLCPGSVITTVARTEAAEAPSVTSMDENIWDSESPSDENHWDGAVKPILQGIAMIQDADIQEQLQQRFHELLGLAQIPPHQTALLHFQMYRTLHNLADAVEEIFERVNEDDSIRPTTERLVQSFYANYLREGAEKEQQDLMEAESVKEFGIVKDKSDLVDMWETELKREVDVASPAENHEMLTYCFKWIQIMTELRCAMPEGFNFYQDDVEREQATVIDCMAQRIADSYADDETKCWNIFSLERQKTELIREQSILSSLMTC